ncbi:transposase [Bacillus sp. NP157]|nr:transposase [Bacillus sp. NP157]QWT22247.1 transposase [Bacillus sp. NP157]
MAVFNHRETQRFANGAAGWEALAAWLAPHHPAQVVLEATGGYEKSALAALHAAGLPVRRINPRLVRYFARSKSQLAKTDRIDARVLAHMASVMELVPFQPPSEEMATLQQYKARRDHLVQNLTAEKQRRRQVVDKTLREDLEAHIDYLENALRRIDAVIGRLIKDTPQARVAATMKGVGPGMVASMICDLPELGHLGRKQIASLVGVAPINCDSGVFRGKQSTWGGRSRPRAMLYMSALSASRHDPILKPYYEGLVTRGKLKRVALIAVMHKLIVILNARMRDELAAMG